MLTSCMALHLLIDTTLHPIGLPACCQPPPLVFPLRGDFLLCSAKHASTAKKHPAESKCQSSFCQVTLVLSVVISIYLSIYLLINVILQTCSLSDTERIIRHLHKQMDIFHFLLFNILTSSPVADICVVLMKCQKDASAKILREQVTPTPGGLSTTCLSIPVTTLVVTLMR